MKSRTRKVVNFFAFNLLFFALYLNFIHKDKTVTTTTHSTESTAVVNTGTTPVDNPENYLNKVGAQQHSDKTSTEKNSIN
jgi:hypothetical protein